MASAAVDDPDFTEENHFVELFDEALSLSRGNLTDEDISKAVEHVIGFFNVRGSPRNACTLNKYKTPRNLCAYFYRFSPVSAGLARKKTLAAIRECDEFRSCLRRPSLKIISLGSGPGSDLVGLCSALYRAAEFKQLDLILVDFNEKWGPFFEVLQRLLRDKHFGNASLLFQNKDIKSFFVCSNVADENNTDHIEYLEEADMIWIKGLFSILPSYSKRTTAMELVVSSMKPGALLVILESPSYSDFPGHSGDIELVYSTNTNKDYEILPHPNMEYGRGLSKSSNQQMFVLLKKSKEEDSK